MDAWQTSFNPLDEGEIYNQFKAMRIEHGLHSKAVQTFERLRLRKVKAPFAEQTNVFLFADTQSGKSTTVCWYIEREIVHECIKRNIFRKTDNLPLHRMVELQSIVLHVKLSGNATMSKLIADILTALGDPRADVGTIPSRKLRLFRLLRAKGVEIIFIDEAQHLKSSAFSGNISRNDEATEVQNLFKDILTSGWPIVFVGMPEAENILFERQIISRSEEPIGFGPLRSDVDDEALIFVKFCGVLGDKLAEHGILPKRLNLLVDDYPEALMLVSGGRLGILTTIVRKAVELSYDEKLYSIERRHLKKVVDSFCIRLGLCSRNPFTRPHTNNISGASNVTY